MRVFMKNRSLGICCMVGEYETYSEVETEVHWISKCNCESKKIFIKGIEWEEDPTSSSVSSWKCNGGRQRVQDMKHALSCPSSTSLWHNPPLPHLITSESATGNISHKALWIFSLLLVSSSSCCPKAISSLHTSQFTWQSFLIDKPCHCGTFGNGYKLQKSCNLSRRCFCAIFMARYSHLFLWPLLWRKETPASQKHLQGAWSYRP